MQANNRQSLPLQKTTMRFTLLAFLIVIIMAGCGETDAGRTISTDAGSRSTDSSKFSSIEWQQKTIDFGKIAEGQKLEVVYHFKNTGTHPLIEPGCGFTVAETPTEPIAPGEEGVIKGAFDSNGRPGTQHKSIFVSANTTGTQQHELVFTVEVDKKS